MNINKGDTVKAVWTDGLEIVGVYSGEERGYFIILDKELKKIPCNKSSVKFELVKLNNKKDNL